MKKLLLILLWSAGVALTAAPYCSYCRKECRRTGWTLDGKNYCSKSCMRAANRCTVCGAGLEAFVTLEGVTGRRLVCCSACADRRPKCFACRLPDRALRRLADGRGLCPPCAAQVVPRAELPELIRRVRRDLARHYGYDARHPIELRVLNRTELNAATPDLPGDEKNAAMRVNCQVVTQTDRNTGRVLSRSTRFTCTLLLLDRLPRELLIETLAHELTHDYLNHRLGLPGNLKLSEGMCEAVAADYNVRRGRPELNVSKQKNPDPIYGAGFRELYPRLRRNGFRRTVEFLRPYFKPFDR